jgi:hypothetical protein
VRRAREPAAHAAGHRLLGVNFLSVTVYCNYLVRRSAMVKAL